MVPEGWVRRNLDQVADVRTGVAKGKTGLKNPVSLPYLRVANVQDGYLDLSEMKEIEVEATQVERYSLREDDIVLTEGGDFDKLGRGTIWRGQISNCLHQNHVFAVRITDPNLMPEFFAMQAGSKYGRDYFLSCAKRSTNLASINSTQLKQFPVLLPPLPEQQKIAEILGTWDKAIETTEALLANARAQKRALMQSLLPGTRRFPGFEDHPWREVRLQQIASIIVSNVDKKSEPDELPVRLCNYTDVYKNDTIRVDMDFMEATATSAQIKKFGLKVGDVIITKDSEDPTDIAVPAYVAETADDLVCGYHLAIIRANGHADGRFLKYCFELPHTRYYFGARANGATRFGLNIDSIETAMVRVPSVAEQSVIADAIQVVEQEISHISNALDHLRTEKKSLMQQLLTGKRRVAV